MGLWASAFVSGHDSETDRKEHTGILPGVVVQS